MSPHDRLWNKDFFLLWQGQFVSQLGTQAFTIAMMYWLMRATGSATLMGTTMMASMLPAVLLGPVGGAVADRFSRRAIIIACDVVSGVGVLSLAGLMFLAPERTGLIAAWLVCISVGGGVVRAFFAPAITAAVPSIVPEARVAAANAVNEGSTHISTIVGQGLGGILFRVLGAPLLLLFDGLTYLFSAVSECFIDIPQALPERARGWRQTLSASLADLREGIAHVRARRGLMHLMVAAAAINFFGVPFMVLLPFYVEEGLAKGPEWFGFLLAASGAGSLLGYSVAGSVRLGRRARTAAMLACLFGVALSLGLLGVIVRPFAALGLIAAAGATSGFFNIHTITLLQTTTPEAMRGRVFGVLHTLVMGLTPVSLALTGVVADLAHHDAPLLLTACGAVLVVVTAAASLDGTLRGFLGGEAEPGSACL
ncbi:MAG: MFS transporter [Candidatus Krumholzibacteria bacterium]|nr:MFS transporter [Candidatus Krumholzibacteria bacterium]